MPNQPSPRELYSQAQTSQQNGQIHQALQQLEQATAYINTADPNKLAFDVLYLKGICHIEASQYQDAVAAYRSAIVVCPEERLLWLPYHGWGFALSALQQLSDAIPPYEKALEYCTDPKALYYTHLELAEAYSTRYDLEAQIKHLESAHQLAKAHNLLEELLDVSHELGDLYIEFEKGQEAVDTLKAGLQIAKEEGFDDWERLFLGNLSTAYLGNGQHEEAKQLALELLAMGEYSGDIDDTTTAFNNLAMYHRAKGDYHIGVDYLKKAIAIEDNEFSKAIEYRNLSRFYEETGDWHSATYYLLTALDIVTREEQWEKVVKYRMQAADLYFSRENYDKAIAYYQYCIEAFEHYPENEALVEALSHLGSCYSRLDEFDKAVDYQQQALKKAEDVRASKHTLSIVYNALGGAYLREDRFDEAEQYYLKSRELDDHPDDIISTFNLAAFYYMTASYQQAEQLIYKAITRFEAQRQNLVGFNRQLFDNRYGQLYEYLAAIKARQEDPLSALKAIELLKSRGMLETMAAPYTESEIAELAALLAPEEAIIYYANTLHDDMLVFLLTRERLDAVFISLSHLRELTKAFAPNLEHFDASRRTLQGSGNAYAKANLPHPGWFDLHILYYRHRLTLDPRLWSSKASRTKAFGHSLYQFLIAPLLYKLKGKSHLSIVPDRSLYLLPFEALVAEEGKYLIENYAISYLPNLALLAQMKERQPTYAQTGLAMGLAEYAPLSREGGSIVQSIEEIPILQMEAQDKIQAGEDLDPLYAKVGVQGWPTLPHVHRELSAIQQQLPGCEVVEGEKVTPSWIRQQAKDGQLSQYRILHFANHGIAIPAVPHLSALVCHKDASGSRYLNASEIEALSLCAELVNLSACETGLGEIIASIGMSGIAYSFLKAGAKSVQASLWEVHDEWTTLFNTAYYRELLAQNWDYPATLAIIKRECIKGSWGPALQNPLYWAAPIWIGSPAHLQSYSSSIMAICCTCSGAISASTLA
jgi:CHAT domain-containing protein/Flp pilus assembly protein TadD